MNPTAQETKEAIERLWDTVPPGSGKDFNIVVTRLEQTGGLDHKD